MDLRKKTLAILFGVIIGIIIVFTVFSFTFFLDNYRKIETGYVTDYSNLVSQNVINEMDNLDLIIRPWGAWDDMYNFVGGGTVDPIKSTFGDTQFINRRLDFIIVTNTQGDIVFGEGFDRENGSNLRAWPSGLTAQESCHPYPAIRFSQPSSGNGIAFIIPYPPQRSQRSAAWSNTHRKIYG
jgi:Predicted periplasmic ligand-binding sensor domain